MFAFTKANKAFMLMLYSSSNKYPKRNYMLTKLKNVKNDYFYFSLCSLELISLWLTQLQTVPVWEAKGKKFHPRLQCFHWTTGQKVMRNLTA